MVALAQRQVTALREAVATCAAATGVEQFRERVVEATRGLVACDAVAYNEVPFDGSPPVTLVDPPDISFPEANQILARHAADNPLITHFARTGDESTYMLSDFLSLSALRKTALYNELYRLMGVRRQLAMVLPSSRTLVIGVTVNRGGSDFDEQDRAVLDAFRPYAGESFRNAVAVSGLAQALDELDEGVVVVDRDGGIAHVTRAAQSLLRQWFPPDDAVASRLPEQLQQWLNAAGSRPGAPGRAVFVRQHDGRTLRIHRLRDVAGHDVLRVVEQRDRLALADLAQLGLTARQAEVLLAMAQGMTNQEIARELSSSTATVRKHVEHLFGRLGVRSRAEAVAVAYRQAGGTPRP